MHSKGNKIIYIGDGVKSLLRIKDFYVFDDNWITKYNKQLCDDNDNVYNVISFEEIEDYICDEYKLTDQSHYPINTWRWVKRSCVKLDKEVNVGDVLYVKSM